MSRADHIVVCLLRSPTDPDPYEEAFVEAGFQVRHIPLLQFQMVNGDRLRAALSRPDAYSALILTSPRAAQALQQQRDLIDPMWYGKPVYAVGPRTAACVKTLGFRSEGEESGSGSELASHIISRQTGGQLLFLCGNRRRDELPQRMREAGIAFEEIVVYETHLKESIDVTDPVPPDWLAFFSPSGVEALASYLDSPDCQVRVAAIGPTTAAALRAAGRAPQAVADAPRPHALLAAIRAVEAGI